MGHRNFGMLGYFLDPQSVLIHSTKFCPYNFLGKYSVNLGNLGVGKLGLGDRYFGMLGYFLDLFCIRNDLEKFRAYNF